MHSYVITLIHYVFMYNYAHFAEIVGIASALLIAVAIVISVVLIIIKLKKVSVCASE